MAEATSSALTKRNSDTALMPPPPPPKRIKRPKNVLDEDVYTDALEHIIARDFFPGLLESQAQKDFLDALDSNNSDWIRESGRNLTQIMTPGRDRGRRGTSMARTTRGLVTPGGAPSATPRGGWEGGTPVRAPSATPGSVMGAGDTFEARRSEVDGDLSLGAFQSKYTSEDNESFNALLDRQNIARAKKYAFMQNGNKILAPRQILHREREQKLLTERQDKEAQGALILRPSQGSDDRKASYETWRSKEGARNSLMFGPDSVEDNMQTHAQAAEERSLAPPRSVSYAATRLLSGNPDAAITGDSIPPSPSMSAVDAAIAGRPRPTASEPGISGAETPRVNGYAFVDAEPTAEELAYASGERRGIPIDDEEADRAELEAAMALLPKADTFGGDTDGNDSGEGRAGRFKLQDRSKREEIHHRLVDKHDHARRAPAGSNIAGSGAGSRLAQLRSGTGFGGDGRTPTPKFLSSPALGSRTPGTPGAGAGAKQRGDLTPAGRMLAAKLGRTPAREGSVFGGRSSRPGGEKKTWTPTPRVKRMG